MALAREPGRSSGWPLIAAVAIALVALILAITGTAVTDGQLAPADVLYRSLQLFVLEGDALPDGTRGNVALELARLLAPLATVLAVLVGLRELLGDRLRRRRIARAQGHTIVCGDGPAATALARNLRADGRTVVLVSTTGDQHLRRDGIAVVTGDPREATTLTAAGLAGAAALYACAAQSATNAAVVLAAGPLRTGVRGRLAAFAQLRNDDLVEALRIHQVAHPGQRGVTIDFFTLDDTAARLLLDRHSPGDGTAPVVIVGFGSFGQALLRGIVRRPGDGGQRRTVLIRATDPARVLDAAEELDAAGRGCDVSVLAAGEEIPAGVERIYVCQEDEDEAVGVALRLARQREREVVACLAHESPFREALRGSLPVFGILDAACQSATIADASIVGRAARTIHEKYRAECERRGDTPLTNPSMRPWQDLAPHLQESNYSQAEHIGAKLADIGATLDTDQPPEPFAFTAQEVVKLARSEHRRWVDERLAAGFTRGPRREGNQHPDLVEWRLLSAESKQKDVDAVTNLPELLAAAGLYLGRRSPRS